MSSCHKRRAAAESLLRNRRRSLRCEPLESRRLLATLVSPWMVWYQDQDGDLVQVRLTQPLLSPANVNDVFRFADGNVNGSTAARQELETLDLSTLDVGPGLSVLVTVIARSRLGDGVANVGSIEATGRSLSTVWVSGDLGAIVAGDFVRTPQSFASLWNDSLRRFDDNRDGLIDLNQTAGFGEVFEVGDSGDQLSTFARMDDDLNGRINFTEFRAYFVRGIDLDNNGTISTVELNAFIGGNPGEASVLIPRRGIDSLSVRSLGDTSKLPRSITAAVDEVFRRYDRNDDGRVDLNPAAGEVSAGQQVNTFSQMDESFDNRVTRRELAAYFSRAVDTNSENVLSSLELNGFAAGDPISFGHLFGKLDEAATPLDLAASEVLRRYDANRDGLLDLNQFLSSREIASPEELSTFSGMDDDFDAKVSFENIRQWLADTVDADHDDMLTLNERLALRNQDPTAYGATFTFLPSRIIGDVGRLEIHQHLSGERLTIDGTLRDVFVGGSILTGFFPLDVSQSIQSLRVKGDVAGEVRAGRDLVVGTIGGSLRAGFDGDFSAGLIQVGRNLNSLVIGRDIVGGPGPDLNGAVVVKGALNSLFVGRDLIGYHHPLNGGSGDPSGYIEARTMGVVTIGRDVKSGAGTFTGIQAAETIGTLTIGRDVIGQFDNHVAITAGGQPLTLARAAEDILKRYDKNKNGFIDLAQNLAKREVVGDAQVNTFGQMDGDFNNKLSLAEIRTYVGGGVDLDTNGVLSPVELDDFSTNHSEANSVLFGSGGPSTPLAEIAAQILRRYDANRDNRIDLRQNIARRELMTPAEINTFGQMDADFNGFVTAAEIVPFFARSVDLDSDQHLIPSESDNFAQTQPEAFSVLFTAPGIDLVGTSGLTDVAIGRLTIGRDLIRTDILAGYDVNLAAIDGDAQITSIVVGRDWIGSSAVAGVQFSSIPAPAIVASSSPTALSDPSPLSAIEFSLPGIVSRIDLILIGRDLVDGPLSTVIAAQEVRRLQIGGSLTPLSAGPSNDDFSLTAGGLTRVIEAPRG